MKAAGTQPAYNAQLAVDSAHGLAVGGFITNACSDRSQLSPMLEEIENNTGVNPVVVAADKGYGALAGLADLVARNIEGYIPQRIPFGDKFSVADFTYLPKTDSFRCPQGKVLTRVGDTARHRIYRAMRCTSCRLRAQCIRGNALNRTLTVSIHAELVSQMRVRTASAMGKRMAKIPSQTVERTFA